MKTAIAVAALVLVSLPAEAISRYNTDGISCEKAQSILDREGAAIFRYKSKRNPSLVLYDRYVAGSRFCQNLEYAEVSSFSTKDDASCQAYVCRMPNYDDAPFGGSFQSQH